MSEAEIRGLIHAREAGRIDNKTYRELNGVETLKASQDLGRLRDASLLSMEGQSTATYYEPTEKLLDTGASRQGELSFGEGEAEITQAEGQTSKLEGQTTQAEGEITQAERRTAKLEQEATQAEGKDATDSEKAMPKELLSMLEEWGGRGSTEELRQLIIDLCQWKALSAVEIADYVERDRYHLARNYLRPLVEEGKLERTRPDAPRSPNQKYRTAPDE